MHSSTSPSLESCLPPVRQQFNRRGYHVHEVRVVKIYEAFKASDYYKGYRTSTWVLPHSHSLNELDGVHTSILMVIRKEILIWWKTFSFDRTSLRSDHKHILHFAHPFRIQEICMVSFISPHGHYMFISPLYFLFTLVVLHKGSRYAFSFSWEDSK
jgi:hypothetical protein